MNGKKSENIKNKKMGGGENTRGRFQCGTTTDLPDLFPSSSVAFDSLWHIWQVRCTADMTEVVVESGLNAPLFVAVLWLGLRRAEDLIYGI